MAGQDLKSIKIKTDIFVSFNVFQHFPSRAYAMEVLDFISNSVSEKPIIVIDIRIDNGDPKYVGYGIADYRTKVGHTYPNCIRIDLFVEMVERVGLKVLHVGLISLSNNVATFWITRK